MTSTSTGSRVPRSLAKFDQYIKTVTAFLLAGGATSNGIRLGLTAAKITQVQGYLTQWYTGNPSSPGLYELHTNPATKTKATRKQIADLIKKFATFFSPLLIRMSGSTAITVSDRLVLNIAAPNTSKTKPRVPITDTVYFEAKPLGGGSMRVTCRVSTDTKRASKPKGADTVQLSYKTGDPAPVGPDDPASKKDSSTHALFTLPLGASSAGQKLYLFARWMNTKHPELAGPWSPLTTVFIG
jgi:hypothetical protein